MHRHADDDTVVEIVGSVAAAAVASALAIPPYKAGAGTAGIRRRKAVVAGRVQQQAWRTERHKKQGHGFKLGKVSRKARGNKTNKTKHAQQNRRNGSGNGNLPVTNGDPLCNNRCNTQSVRCNHTTYLYMPS